jgi:RND family efflux transporter MFP subunit
VRKLELWGIDGTRVEQLARLDQPPRTIAFASPVTAEVSERMVVEGAAVTMGERVLRLADRSVVWLDAQVFEQDLPFVSMDQAVTATVESFPGEEFGGRIVHIHPQVDPMTRTTMVRIELDNAALRLRPGMYATMHISAEMGAHATLVPDEAVIDTGVRQIVFVARDRGRFEPREVRTGLANADGTVQVLAGLTPGEVVVTSGQFLLDAESRMREAIQKYLDQRAGDRPGRPAPALPGHQH